MQLVMNQRDRRQNFPSDAASSSTGSNFDSFFIPGMIQASQVSQQNIEAVDPWAFYGGNIAAACRATNDAVVEQQRAEAKEKGSSVTQEQSAEKKRQRETSRLTAWQSRERKRIEFEVLQERQTELRERNEKLKKDNDELKLLIAHFKSTHATIRDLSPTPIAPGGLNDRASQPIQSNQVGLLNQPAVVQAKRSQKRPRLKQTDNLFFPSSGMNSVGAGADIPIIGRSSSAVQNFFSPQEPSLHSQASHDRSTLSYNDMIAPTNFAPLTRRISSQTDTPSQQQATRPQVPLVMGGLDLSSLMDPPQKVDVPLFRAVQKAPKKQRGDSNTSEGKRTQNSNSPNP